MSRAEEQQRDRPRTWKPTKHTARGRPSLVAYLSTTVPVLIIAAVALVSIGSRAGTACLPLLVIAPVAAAAVHTPWGVIGIGSLALAVGITVSVRNGGTGTEEVLVLSALLAVTLSCSLVSGLRRHRERVLADVRSVAEAAQYALLRPVAPLVGRFQVAVRYSAAAAEARIGGDLYALVPTPYGVRLIVGDVRGKGLAAVGTAALVLGIFREAAYDEPDLLDVVARIERSLARNLGPDDFVTVIVAGNPRAGSLELVNCGHCPPLLVHDGVVTSVEPAHPAPPLGLGPLSRATPSLQVLAFTEGDQLLLYTDGVTEARNRKREFYPLEERVPHHLCDDPARTLATLHDELLGYVGGRLDDDAALLLLRYPMTPGPALPGDDREPAAGPAPPAEGPAPPAPGPGPRSPGPAGTARPRPDDETAPPYGRGRSSSSDRPDEPDLPNAISNT